MAYRSYTEEERSHALKLYADLGAAEAGRQTGINHKTISGWARRDGVQTDAPEQTRAATEMAAARVGRKRVEIREKLADRASELLDRINQPHDLFVGKDGEHRTIPYAGPEGTRNLMVGVGVAIDKLRLEFGEATDRTEHVSQSDFDREVAGLVEKVRRNGGTNGNGSNGAGRRLVES